MKKRLILVFLSIIVSSNLVAISIKEIKDKILANIDVLSMNELDLNKLDFFPADDAGKEEILTNTDKIADAILNSLKTILDALKADGNFSVNEKEQIMQDILQKLTDTLSNLSDYEFKNKVDALYRPYFNITDIFDVVGQDYPNLQDVVDNLKDLLEKKDQPVQAAENGDIPDKVIQDIEKKIISTLEALALSNIDFKDSDPQGQKQVIAQIKDDSQALIKLLSQLLGVASNVPENDPSVTRAENIFQQYLDELKNFEPEFKNNIMNITYPLLAEIHADVEDQQPALIDILDQIMIEYVENLIANLSDTIDNYLKNLKSFNDGFAAADSDAARQEILKTIEKITTPLTKDLTNLFDISISLAQGDQKINTINNVFQGFLNQFKSYNQEFKKVIIDEMTQSIVDLARQANQAQSPLTDILMNIIGAFTKEEPTVEKKPMSEAQLVAHLNNFYQNLAALAANLA